MKVDLHCHSAYSDGTLTPKEVVIRAVEAGISLLSLTDHDTLAGLPEAQAAAEEYDISLVPGVEISADWEGKTIHVVGLNIDPQNVPLQSHLADSQAMRNQRSEQMLQALQGQGLDLYQAVQDQLLPGGIVTRTHIARALINAGVVRDMNRAFKRYLGVGKQAYVKSDWPALEAVVGWIEAAQGVAVLAHPMRYRIGANRLIKLVEDFADAGGKALEVVTSTQDANQVRRCEQLVQQYRLFASVGSDFHSPDQPWARLGSCAPLPSTVQPVWESFL